MAVEEAHPAPAVAAPPPHLPTPVVPVAAPPALPKKPASLPADEPPAPTPLPRTVRSLLLFGICWLHTSRAPRLVVCRDCDTPGVQRNTRASSSPRREAKATSTCVQGQALGPQGCRCVFIATVLSAIAFFILLMALDKDVHEPDDHGVHPVEVRGTID